MGPYAVSKRDLLSSKLKIQVCAFEIDRGAERNSVSLPTT